MRFRSNYVYAFRSRMHIQVLSKRRTHNKDGVSDSLLARVIV